MKLLAGVFVLLLSTFAHSQWYEASGTAIIKGGDEQKAKSQAMQNALKKALLVAGASVSSVQQVVNGLLTQDEINIRASGSVNSVELISEQYADDSVTVNIRADIFPEERQCYSADYRKGLLLTRANLLHREQANIGSIYQIDQLLVKTLARKLQQQSRFVDTRLALKNKVDFSRFNQSIYKHNIRDITMSLASMTDSQYVMFTEINDVSFADKINNQWQFWQDDIRDRRLAFTTYVYNGQNGELMFEKYYQNEAPWTFKQRAAVDLNSQSFIDSEYGAMFDQTLNDVAMDIDENIMCLPTRGKIIQLVNNELTVNLGAKQGVKIGDEFSLLHLNNFVDTKGKTHAGFSVSPYKVKVTQVSEETARAESLDNQVFGNIQINDLVVRN